jgi:hypothetical protein
MSGKYRADIDVSHQTILEWNGARKENLFPYISFLHHKRTWPITVVARSREWTIFDRFNTGIVGSNRIQGMDVCVRLFCVLSCV